MILIKKYANRKLYNTDSSKYINLQEFNELCMSTDKQVKVVCNKTRKDLTKLTHLQYLVYEEQRKLNE